MESQNFKEIRYLLFLQFDSQILIQTTTTILLKKVILILIQVRNIFKNTKLSNDQID